MCIGEKRTPAIPKSVAGQTSRVQFEAVVLVQDKNPHSFKFTSVVEELVDPMCIVFFLCTPSALYAVSGVVSIVCLSSKKATAHERHAANDQAQH